MTEASVLAVGNPPTFRLDVARAMNDAPEEIEWVPNVTGAQTAVAESDSGFALIVISPSIDAPDALGLAEHVGHRAPATAMVVVRDKHPDGLLPLAMRAGIRDVVDLTRGNGELQEALKRALTWSANLRVLGPGARRPEPGHQGRMFTVFSSKGGTGKTFLSTNLALAVATETGKDVALVDMDLKAGDVFSLFGMEPRRSMRDLVALGREADEAAVRQFGEQLHEHVWGYAAVPDPAETPISGESMTVTLQQLREAYDYVVVDGTDDYDDHVLAAFDMSDAVCLITGLDMVGVRHLSLALDTLLTLGVPRDRLRMVLNRADSKVGLGPDDVERVLKLRVDAMIPSSRLVPVSVNRAKPLYLGEPKSEVAKSITALAQRLSQEQPARKRSLFKRD